MNQKGVGMITIRSTLVRMKKTKEPVAIFERENDIIELGRKVDEVCDPSLCEYLDIDLNVNFSLLCHIGSHVIDDTDFYEEIISGATLTGSMSQSIATAFQNKKNKWLGLPCGVDFLSTGLSIDDRFGACSESSKDVF
jgi:hypothetical protein